MRTLQEDSAALLKLSAYTKYDPSLDKDIELTRHNFVFLIAICCSCDKIIQSDYHNCFIIAHNMDQLKNLKSVKCGLVVNDTVELCPDCYHRVPPDKQGIFYDYNNTERKKYWSTISCEKLFYVLLDSNFLLW